MNGSDMEYNAISVELKNIDRRLGKLESFIDSYDKRQEAFFEQHCKQCGAFGFFDDNALRDKLFNTIYDFSNQQKNSEKRVLWLRWLFSVPLAGLVIERILQHFSNK